MLIILERDGLAFKQVLGAAVLYLRQVERGTGLVKGRHRRDEIVLRLHRVGGLNDEQGLALGLRCRPAEPAISLPAGIRRKYRRRAIFIDRDLAFGDSLGPEGALGRRLDGQAGPFS